jgi:hypothetical protein
MGRLPDGRFTFFDTEEVPEPPEAEKALVAIREGWAAKLKANTNGGLDERIDALLRCENAWRQVGAEIPPSECDRLFGVLLFWPELYEKLRFTMLPVAPKRTRKLAENLLKELDHSASVSGLSASERRTLLGLLRKMVVGGAPGHTPMSRAMPPRKSRPEAPRTFIVRLVQDFIAKFSKKPMRSAIAALATAATDIEVSENAVRKTRSRRTPSR